MDFDVYTGLKLLGSTELLKRLSRLTKEKNSDLEHVSAARGLKEGFLGLLSYKKRLVT